MLSHISRPLVHVNIVHSGFLLSFGFSSSSLQQKYLVFFCNNNLEKNKLKGLKPKIYQIKYQSIRQTKG